ncbi:MAG: prepilin-type N-terminal cleavage/methylation domain-containing protein [Casimicrobiaceae bacterium]
MSGAWLSITARRHCASGGGSRKRGGTPAPAAGRRVHGFTLIELMLALMLMAGMASILYGSLNLAARSWDGGEANAERVSNMRSTASYLRAQLSEQYPQRMWKVAETPLLFAGDENELRYTAVLPERVADGGVYYFRLAVVRTGEKSQLVQERVVPDVGSLERPDFREADRSVLADGIAEVKVGYFGRDAKAADVDTPTWRDRWEDNQRLPLLVRLDVKPVKGAPWPTLVVEPRRSPEAGCVYWDAGQGRCARGGR